MENIKIQDQAFFEDLIWMSARYCIGRHTTASISHARHIAKYADMMGDEFRKKMAVEIRNEIDRGLTFQGNIKIENRFYDDSIDVASLIAKALAETDPDENVWADTLYTIDKRDHTVTVSIKLGCAYQKISTVICDYLPWAKLANYLDKSTWRDVVIEYNGKRETCKCFPYVQKIFSAETDYSYVVSWCRIENACAEWDVFISPEYIKEIL
jgi:hypothetical protein